MLTELWPAWRSSWIAGKEGLELGVEDDSRGLAALRRACQFMSERPATTTPNGSEAISHFRTGRKLYAFLAGRS